MFPRILAAVTISGLLAGSALAQETATPETIPFGGGAFTITETPDYEKILTYEGREIARNYVVFFDREVTVGETPVALFSVGDGGNACGPATVIAWKKDGALESTLVGEDCGAPPAAVSDSRIYFVPYLVPGDTAPLQYWSPDEGVRTAGDLSFTPQPDTGWEDFDPRTGGHIVSALDNAAIYEAAQTLLGDDLDEVVGGLLTGGEAELQGDGTIAGHGCVPHACGTADSFMAVDPKARKLYFAQQDDTRIKAWPDLAAWPSSLRTAMEAAIGPNRQ